MVIDPNDMLALAEIETGIMPHGTRINSTGTRNYHVSMMSDELIEVNTINMKISRRLSLVEKAEQAHTSSSPLSINNTSRAPVPKVKPTWADPHPTKPLVYVAGNGSDEILEIDVNSWQITRRFNTGKAPYNLEVSANGKRLVVSYKGEGSTGIWDLESGKELAKIANTRRVSHGVALSPDSRFAFISVEGIGGEPGSVDVIDLQVLELIDFVETGKQAGGIYFWKQKD
jgi:DNA-binding beta-propeller fold protein YncE